MVKQRKDSVSQFEAANREDLAAIERAEIVVIEKYLPAKLGEAEIQAAIDAAVAETGATGPADMGKLMGVLKPKLAGQADMGLVSALVKKKFAELIAFLSAWRERATAGPSTFRCHFDIRARAPMKCNEGRYSCVSPPPGHAQRARTSATDPVLHPRARRIRKARPRSRGRRGHCWWRSYSATILLQKW